MTQPQSAQPANLLPCVGFFVSLDIRQKMKTTRGCLCTSELAVGPLGRLALQSGLLLVSTRLGFIGQDLSPLTCATAIWGVATAGQLPRGWTLPPPRCASVSPLDLYSRAWNFTWASPCYVNVCLLSESITFKSHALEDRCLHRGTEIGTAGHRHARVQASRAGMWPETAQVIRSSSPRCRQT